MKKKDWGIGERKGGGGRGREIKTVRKLYASLVPLSIAGSEGGKEGGTRTSYEQPLRETRTDEVEEMMKGKGIEEGEKRVGCQKNMRNGRKRMVTA